MVFLIYYSFLWLQDEIPELEIHGWNWNEIVKKSRFSSEDQ